MVFSILFLAAPILFASFVFPLQPESIQKSPKSIRRNTLQKRVPPDSLCPENEEWSERECDGAHNEIAWIDYCWDPVLHEFHEYEGACDGGFMCVDNMDDEGHFIIDCIPYEGDITDVESNGEGDGQVQWVDLPSEDEEEEEADEHWAGEVIDDEVEVGEEEVPREVVRFMNHTIGKAAFSAVLLSSTKNYVVMPHMPITVTVGNLQRPLCTWNATHRHCEPKERITLWHGDRINIKYSLWAGQAVSLVYTMIGAKAKVSHSHRKYARFLLEAETD